MDNHSIIDFSNVGLRYGTHDEVLRHIDLTIDKGSFHFVTGKSGAGKTSFVKMLSLEKMPTRGLLHIFGENIGSLSRDEKALIRRKIGIVFQDYQLLNHLNVFDNIALALNVRDGFSPNMHRDIKDLIHWLGLNGKEDFYPQTLSGGEQQRLAVARAVASRPDILLADEPTGNLDDAMALRLMYLFEEMNRRGTTVILVTHNQKLVERYQYPILHLQETAIYPYKKFDDWHKIVGHDII